MNRATRLLSLAVLVALALPGFAADLIPSADKIKTDRPRVLLRPKATPHAVSLAQLRELPRDADLNRILSQLKEQKHAAAQALVWLMTGDRAAADRAVERMKSYRYPGKVDTFHIFFRLSEFGLAYDWLYDYPGFTPEIKAEVRRNVRPLAEEGFKATNDHMFHNYIWMSAGGVALWSLATAGEDADSDRLFEQIRTRFNRGLFPAWRYLDGLPSEPMGYWALYVFAPGLWTVLGTQSAFETDLVSVIRKEENGWLDRHFENLIHSTLPDMRYIPWGDLQSGPNGGVTMEMAGILDAAAWALASPEGARMSQSLAAKRGLSRFYGETAIFYPLYTRHVSAAPKTPSLSFLSGNRQSGHFIARSSWEDDATIVAFRCTDHFGDHHHYDQGSFLIYRKGLLAVDPPVYRTVRGPQQRTEHHNTLLVGGRPQRPARGQWFVTVEDFQKNLQGGRKLETGDILFHRDAGPWAAVAGQFAQAYDCEELQSCVRQLLFVRPGKVVVVDHLKASPGRELPEVQWLLQTPSEPKQEAGAVQTDNGKSWLRCRAILPESASIAVAATPVGTHCVRFTYAGKSELTLVHAMETGDGTKASAPAAITAQREGQTLQVRIEGMVYEFDLQTPHSVTCRSE